MNSVEKYFGAKVYRGGSEPSHGLQTASTDSKVLVHDLTALEILVIEMDYTPCFISKTTQSDMQCFVIVETNSRTLPYDIFLV